MVSSNRSEKSHCTLKCTIRLCDQWKVLQIEDGAFAPFFRPRRWAFGSSSVPVPGNLPSMGKKCQCPEVTPRGHGRTWNRLMHNRSDFDQSWRYRYLTRQTDARCYDFSNKHGDTENQAPLRSTDARHLVQSTKNSTNSNSSSRWILVRKNTGTALSHLFSLFTIHKCIVEWASQIYRPRYKCPDIFKDI